MQFQCPLYLKGNIYRCGKYEEGKMFGVGDKPGKLRKNKDKTLFKHNYEGRTIVEKAEQFFFPIYGLRDIKEKLYQVLTDSEQNNILLIGPGSSSKDMFLIKIHDQCNDVIYYDPALEKSPDLADQIYKNKNAKVIIIDNINKLRKSDWNILPNLLKNGIIEKTTKTDKSEIKMDSIKIFAALDDQNRLDNDGPLGKLRALFIEYNISEYNDEEFIEFVKFYCRNKLPDEKSETMARELIKYNSKVIKEVISFSKILRETDTKEDIVRIIEDRMKHRTS
jgi:hypothetical protein